MRRVRAYLHLWSVHCALKDIDLWLRDVRLVSGVSLVSDKALSAILYPVTHEMYQELR